MNFERKDFYDMDDLLSIVRILRSPEGCPWDRVQTHQTLRRNMLEEAYEAVEAIDLHDVSLLREELGDVLLQVILHCQISADEKEFTFSEVCNGLAQKLVFRHPHVFGNQQAANSEDALMVWEKQKREEKNQTTVSQTLQQVARSLPALMRAEKVQSRLVKGGFEADSSDVILQQLLQKLSDLEDGTITTTEEKASAVGNMFYGLVQLSRQFGIDPEEQLNQATNDVIEQVIALEQEQRAGF